MNNNYKSAIKNRYDFVMIYDVENGNPNGDPDAGNLPRIDPETGHGIVTDVCIKRKIRNSIVLRNNEKSGFEIYIQQDAVLSNQDKHGVDAANAADKKDKDKRSQSFREAMCEKFFDIRAFGAVMTTAAKDPSLINSAGQVRGPIQIAFGRSIDPIVPREITITRMAVATDKDKEKAEKEGSDESGGSRSTMGRKAIVPYGVYRQEGYISANLASAVTGFSDTDLEAFWDAVIHMFDEDRSAARGKMALRELIVFKHDSSLGNAPSHKLFDRVKISCTEGIHVPRKYTDYNVTICDDSLPPGVEIIRKYQDND
ncbi:MAG: type I-C CRISPR-associated protein Cas7/Csd2 [Defluviitaleaceae bacterium]|nr:type I-C CRISPR-associated protein Cas7/Csd2 [Defluviitaleaceae bacterium]